MNQGNNNNKKTPQPNPLELLREAGRESTPNLRKDLINPLPKDIAEQIFGKRKKNFSGEIMPGEAIEMREVYSGKAGETETYKKQLYYERRLRQEDQVLVERRTQELRIQIQAIHEEIEKVAKITPQLTQEVQIAAFQAPGDPSTYELFFLQRIFEFIKSFRKHIEEANTWLSTSNKRSRKKNAWGQNYSKYGAKYLLSGEHYLSRSSA